MAKHSFLTIHKEADRRIHLRCIAENARCPNFPSRTPADKSGTTSSNKYAKHCWSGILVDAGMLMVEHHLGSPNRSWGRGSNLLLNNRFHTQPAAALFSYFIFGPRTDSGQTFILSIERGRDVRKASVVRHEFVTPPLQKCI